MVIIQADAEFNLEAEKWTGYHIYLIIYLSIVTFFGLFSIVYTGLILDKLIISFGWGESEILIIFSIIGISGLFTIIPRWLSDRYGRKSMMLIFNVIFSISIISSALAPETVSFIALRFIAGIFGINVGLVMIAEEIPAKSRGRAYGITTGVGMSSSILAAYLLTFTGLSVDTWRYIYSIVCLIGLIIITSMWFKIRETKRFDHAREKQISGQSVFSVFRRKYLRILVLSSLIAFTTNWIYLTIKRYFKLFLLYDRGFDPSTVDVVVGSWLIPIYFGSIIGYYASGFLADKLGRKNTIYLTVSTYFVGSMVFLNALDITLIFIGLFIINISFSIYRMIVDLLAVEFFPTEIRSSGSGWVIVFASISGIMGGFVMYYLFEILGGWGMIFLVIGTLCLVILVILTFFIPETKQRVVDEIYLTEIEKKEQ